MCLYVYYNTNYICIGPQSLADNEYSRAGNYDPKVLITTSRDPSSRLQQFAKELRLIFPNSQRINRGNHVISELVTACKSNDVTDLVILHEHRGVPGNFYKILIQKYISTLDGIIISHFPHGPTAFFTLSNVVLRHDIPEAMEKKVSEAFPHLIFSNFTTNIGNRTKTILKHLFPVPKDDSKRVISMINQKDYISFRHHVFKPSRKEVEMVEIGPRFEMKLFQVKLGTVDMDEADTEWVLRPYMNTTKKRTYL